MGMHNHPVAFLYEINTWPPKKAEGVTYYDGVREDRESYPLSQYTFNDFCHKPSRWINAHTGRRLSSSGKIDKRDHDIIFEDDGCFHLGPFIHMNDRFVCENWILITDEVAFDQQYYGILREQFAHGDNSHLVQGVLF
jgi:hypothetical protein